MEIQDEEDENENGEIFYKVKRTRATTCNKENLKKMMTKSLISGFSTTNFLRKGVDLIIHEFMVQINEDHRLQLATMQAKINGRQTFTNMVVHDLRNPAESIQ